MAYWQKRQEAVYKAGEFTVNQYFTKLEKAFNQAKRELQKTVESFYWQYAEENGLTYAEVQKRLSKAEIGEMREYIDLVMQNIGKYNQKVNNMSIKARMTRYQALEAQVDAILRELYAVDYEADAGKMMSEVYADTYHRIWYDSDRYHGFHAEFAQIEPRTVEELLKYPFNGADFSTRLWKQKDHLQSQLMESLTTMMIQGTAPQNLAKDFAKKMQAKKFDAYRLLHTESSFVMSEATHAGYKEDGVEKYQILATLDSKTCGICGRLDGKIYPVSEAVTGKNKPPFHPFCRCTDVPYYPDTPTEGMKRAARDKDGNGIEVPTDMTYEEWKKKYLGDAEQSDIMDIAKTVESATMGAVTMEEVPDVHSIGKIDKEIYRCVTPDIATDEVIITDTQIKHIQERHPNDYERFSTYFNRIVSEPDYIIRANRPNTALILKEIREADEVFKTVLRLITSKDNPEYKNSIITFMKIDEKEWNRLLRNKEILYKKE